MCARCGRPVAVAAAQPAIVAGPPSSVRVAILLLLVSWGIPLLMLARAMVLYGPRIGIMAQSIAGAILWLVLIAFLWQRQSWARFGVLILLVWVLGSLVLSVLRIGGAIPWGLAPAVAADLMRICAVFLLFRPESNAWFQQNR